MSSLPPLPAHLDPRGRHRGGRAWRSGATRVALSVLSLLSVALLIAAGYYWYTFRSINNGVTKYKIGQGQAPSNAVPYNGKDVNILLVGNDDRTNMTNAEVKALKVGRDGGSLATDSMMIVHIPADGKRATLLSLPRDSYVNIPGHGKAKLNSAYADAYTSTSGSTDAKRGAGANLLEQTVGDLTGLRINHYVQVDLLGFYRISNAIGGVPVTLCHSVDDTVKANGGDGGSHLVLSKGRHTLKGVQALEFVRQRHGLTGGDLDRVKRQQYFLTAAFRQVASVGILTKLKDVGDAVKRSIFTDDGLDLLGLGRQLENLSAGNIIGKTIPTTSGFQDGQDVLVVKPAKVRAFVTKLLNPAASTSSASAPPTSHRATTAASTPPTSATSSKAIDSKCIN